MESDKMKTGLIPLVIFLVFGTSSADVFRFYGESTQSKNRVDITSHFQADNPQFVSELSNHASSVLRKCGNQGSYLHFMLKHDNNGKLEHIAVEDFAGVDSSLVDSISAEILTWQFPNIHTRYDKIEVDCALRFQNSQDSVELMKHVEAYRNKKRTQKRLMILGFSMIPVAMIASIGILVYWFNSAIRAGDSFTF